MTYSKGHMQNQAVFGSHAYPTPQDDFPPTKRSGRVFLSRLGRKLPAGTDGSGKPHQE